MKHNYMIFALIILISSGAPIHAIGIGIAPNDMKINGALRGTEYERTLTIFNTGEDAGNFTLRTEGQAASWISFHGISEGKPEVANLSIAGNNLRSLIVRINIPDDEPIGNYNATIYVNTVPSGAGNQNGTVETVLMAKAEVKIGLTGEQVVDGAVNTVTIAENTEPGYPLRIQASFKNTGNVVAAPEISVKITKDGTEVNSFSYSSAKVRPSETETIVAEWNTTSADTPGEYVANVAISLDGRELSSNSIPFSVLPLGTLSRQGNLTAIVLDDTPAVGAAVKVNAYFKNTGTIDTLAKFSGEAYLDGVRTDALTSDELRVKAGSEAPLASYLKISSPGNYRVTGRVVYEGKETETKEISFAVADTGENNASSPNRSYALVSAAVLIVGALAFVIRRKMNNAQ